jgi:hypothetical protein
MVQRLTGPVLMVNPGAWSTGTTTPYYHAQPGHWAFVVLGGFSRCSQLTAWLIKITQLALIAWEALLRQSKP